MSISILPISDVSLPAMLLDVGVCVPFPSTTTTGSKLSIR